MSFAQDLVAASDAQGHDPQKVVAGLLFAGYETTDAPGTAAAVRREGDR